MGFRARNSSSRSDGLRRNSRRSSRSFLDNFDEPDLLNDGNPGLRTTGQGLSDYPDETALTSLVDPDRVQRQQNRTTPKVTRRPPRSVNENGNIDKSENRKEPGEEKLFLRLKRNLVDDPQSRYSDMRESPVRGNEDYRHNRLDTKNRDDGGRSRKRRRTSNGINEPSQTVSSRRSRRSTRPAVYDYEPSVDPEETGSAVEQHKQEESDINYASASTKEDRKTKRANGKDQKHPSHKESEPHSPSDENLETKNGVKTETTPEVKPDAEKQDNKPKGLVNNDYCNSCGGTGELLCCETCVRSFHFSCIEPPVMSVEEIPEDEWSCRHCKPTKFEDHEKEAVSKTLFGPLILSLESHNSVAYQLPTHVRELFAHVQTTKFGEFADEFMKTDHIAPGPRIQDKNGNTLLCYKCKESSLRGKEMAVCSRCQEAWHIDCVDPPLESTPLGYWVCPLHVDNTIELPLRVKKPLLTQVSLKRRIPNSGDIEIAEEDEETEVGENNGPTNKTGEKDQTPNEEADDSKVTVDRENAGSFSDEEVTRSIPFPSQTRMLPNGSLVAKSSRIRQRSSDNDRIVYKLPSRTIKLDFLDAVHERRQDTYRETPVVDFMFALDCLAERPQPDREAVRNLMQLKLQGPSISAASAKDNLNTLLDAALNDENEIGQVAAIRKLMQEKGKERLLHLLSSNN